MLDARTGETRQVLRCQHGGDEHFSEQRLPLIHDPDDFRAVHVVFHVRRVRNHAGNGQMHAHLPGVVRFRRYGLHAEQITDALTRVHHDLRGSLEQRSGDRTSQHAAGFHLLVLPKQSLQDGTEETFRRTVECPRVDELVTDRERPSSPGEIDQVVRDHNVPHFQSAGNVPGVVQTADRGGGEDELDVEQFGFILVQHPERVHVRPMVKLVGESQTAGCVMTVNRHEREIVAPHDRVPCFTVNGLHETGTDTSETLLREQRAHTGSTDKGTRDSFRHDSDPFVCTDDPYDTSVLLPLQPLLDWSSAHPSCYCNCESR